jgi:hypothetical protein
LTAFVTSLRPAEAAARALALSSLLLIAACGGGADTARSPQPTDAPSTAPKTPPDVKPPSAVPPSGLSPLPTPQQVVTSVSVGRRDPFGPLPGTGQSGSGKAGGSSGRPSPSAPSLPAEFRFTGVISSAGGSEAVVQYGPLSGSVRPGDRGGRTTDLLPPGWSVAAINVSRGTVTLSHSGRNVRVDL